MVVAKFDKQFPNHRVVAPPCHPVRFCTAPFENRLVTPPQKTELKNYVNNLEERYDSSLPTFENTEEDVKLFHDLENFLKKSRSDEENND